MGRKLNESTPIKSKSIGLYGKKEFSSAVRRSGRIRNQNPPSQNKAIEPVVEIDIVEDDMAYEPDNVEAPGPSEKSLEERVDYIFQAVEELKSKAFKPEDDVPMNDLSYKSLYFDSQKKIEALTKENYELSKKAEVSLGKMEAYGEATRVWSEMFGQIKDLLVASNLPKKPIRKTKNLSSLTRHVASEANDVVENFSRALRNKKAKITDPPKKAIQKAENLSSPTHEVELSAPTKANGVVETSTRFTRNKKAKTGNGN